LGGGEGSPRAHPKVGLRAAASFRAISAERFRSARVTRGVIVGCIAPRRAWGNGGSPL